VLFPNQFEPEQMHDSSPPIDRLRFWERLGMAALVGVIVVFGVIVEIRSALLSRHMGDAGVYLRAAWAARMGGADLYTIVDDNGWHYHYPPLLAVVLMPLANPPAFVPAELILPYPVSIALWYMLSVFSLAWSLHTLAAALAPEDIPSSRRWWLVRLLPLLACLGTVGETLGRGQINCLVLAGLCGWLASSLRGRQLRAGLWLSLAICLKIIPAFLLLVPLVRRERRCLAGCALGLLVGLIVVPTLVLGPRQTLACYRAIGETVIGPGLGIGDDTSRAVELTNVTGTHSQSFLSILHNALHPNRATRPPDASDTLRIVHLILGGCMTFFTLWVFRRRGNAPDEVLLGGCIILTMLMLSPISHMHYFCEAIPLLMGLIVLSRGEGAYPTCALCLLLAFNGLVSVMPYLPGLKWMQDLGAIGLSALLLWAVACGMRGRNAPAQIRTGLTCASGWYHLQPLPVPADPAAPINTIKRT
jgi:hypothetical protein